MSSANVNYVGYFVESSELFIGRTSFILLSASLWMCREK